MVADFARFTAEEAEIVLPLIHDIINEQCAGRVSRFAKTIEISETTVSRWVNGKRRITPYYARLVEKKFGVDLIGKALQKTPKDFVAVSGFEFAAGSAGGGIHVEESGIPQQFNVPVSFFQHSPGKNSKLLLVKVFGDSMEPYLMDGAKAIFDTGITTLHSGKIHLIRQNAEFFVKMVNRIDSKKIELISANPRFSNTILDSADGEIEIIGKLVLAISNF